MAYTNDGKQNYQDIVKSMRDNMVTLILDSIEKNPTEWNSGWTAIDATTPINGRTNRAYNGFNSIYLYCVAKGRGYKDSRWVTFNQAKELGASVKKGEKSSPVLFYQLYDKNTKKEFNSLTVRDMTDEEKKQYMQENVRRVLQYSTVFNAEQCDRFPERTDELPKMTEEERTRQNVMIEEIINNSAAPIYYDGGNRAYYSPGSDSIHLPKIDAFHTMQDFYATALHEIAHSTGHESRLNRFGAYGSADSYAVEELRAELASVFMQRELGITLEGRHFENHAAYLNSWLNAVRNDKRLFFDAVRDAEKISDYVAENYLHAERSAELDAQANVVSNEKTQEKNPMADLLSANQEKRAEEERIISREHKKEDHKKPLVVNFYAGPGAGKTTAALELTAALKKAGYNVEYVSEYAKELVLENKLDLLKDQEHVTDEQYHRLDRLRNSGVDIVVTDSPVMLGKIYGEGKISAEYDKKISEYYESFDNFNLVVKRGDHYQTEGRLQTLEESQTLDKKITNLLQSNKMFYGNYHHDEIEKTVARIDTTFKRLFGREQEGAGREQSDQSVINSAELDARADVASNENTKEKAALATRYAILDAAMKVVREDMSYVDARYTDSFVDEYFREYLRLEKQVKNNGVAASSEPDLLQSAIDEFSKPLTAPMYGWEKSDIERAIVKRISDSALQEQATKLIYHSESLYDTTPISEANPYSQIAENNTELNAEQTTVQESGEHKEENHYTAANTFCTDFGGEYQFFLVDDGLSIEDVCSAYALDPYEGFGFRFGRPISEKQYNEIQKIGKGFNIDFLDDINSFVISQEGKVIDEGYLEDLVSKYQERAEESIELDAEQTATRENGEHKEEISVFDSEKNQENSAKPEQAELSPLEKLRAQAEEYVKSTGKPHVLIEWSESKDVPDKTIMTFQDADQMLRHLNSVHSDEGYYKTKLHIFYQDTESGEVDTYNELRFDIGTESAGLVEHIEEFANNADAIAAGFTNAEEQQERLRIANILREYTGRDESTQQTAAQESREHKKENESVSDSDRSAETAEKKPEQTLGEELAQKATWLKIELPKDAIGGKFGNNTLIRMPEGEYSHFGLFVDSKYLKKNTEEKWTLTVGDKHNYRITNDGRRVELSGKELKDVLSGKELGRTPERYAASKKNKAALDRLAQNIPAELKALPCWGVYFTTPPKDPSKTKRDKVILSPTDGHWAKANEPSAWTDFDTAMKYALATDKEGLSLLLTKESKESGITCIDLDECIDAEGKYNGIASKLTEELKGTYAERSVSGNGLHIFVKDDVLKDGKYKSAVKTPNGDLEVYDSAHIISLTGDMVSKTNEITKCPIATTLYLREQLGERQSANAASSAPTSANRGEYRPGTDNEVIERIRKSKRGAEFDAIYSGKGYTGNKSVDDMKLANILAFFTNCDEAQCLRIMKDSGSYRSDKSDDYYMHTIGKAVDTLFARPTKGATVGAEASKDPNRRGKD